MQSAVTHEASCTCNTVSMKITGPVLFRACCHCTSCQAYCGDAYSDVSVFRATDVELADETRVEFKGYQKPALAKRGKCTACLVPVIENIAMPVLPDLRVVPTELLPASLKQDIEFHIFYHRRLQDATDDLPKYSGFVSSQLAFMKALIRSLRKT